MQAYPLSSLLVGVKGETAQKRGIILVRNGEKVKKNAKCLEKRMQKEYI